MSSAKGPILLIAGGCAAMVGAAALTVSLGSFFVDLPTQANAAVVADLPVKKVRTVSLTPEAAAAAVAKPEPANPPAEPAAAEQTVASVTPHEDALHQADPRWARNASAPADASAQDQNLESAFADSNDPASNAGAAASEELGQSGEPFANLENPDGVALEPTVEDVPSPAPRREAKQESDDDEAGPVSGRQATISSGVNLRSGPRSGSRVIGTVPRGAKVTIAAGCQNWCRVTYKGRTGYVWRAFVGGARAEKPRSRRSAQAQQPAEQQTAQSGLFGNRGTINNAGVTVPSRTRAAAAQAVPATNDEPKNLIFEPTDR